MEQPQGNASQQQHRQACFGIVAGGCTSELLPMFRGSNCHHALCERCIGLCPLRCFCGEILEGMEFVPAAPPANPSSLLSSGGAETLEEQRLHGALLAFKDGALRALREAEQNGLAAGMAAGLAAGLTSRVDTPRDFFCSCAVCLTTERTHAFLPCGHRVVCQACGENCVNTTGRCCICQSPSIGVLRIFD